MDFLDGRWIVTLVVIFIVNVFSAWSQTVLTPSYFNVAEGKKIEATATCGEGFTSPGERYCKLTGNTADVIRPGEQEIILGQYCDYCEPGNRTYPNPRAHPIHHAIDGTEKWWQSPPLSRGMDLNLVNVTIDLGQLYHVAYIIIKSANSPRPGQWVLERSRDYGETYEAWQYFAESESDCQDVFGMESIQEIMNDDDIICTADYSDIVPLEDGEIVVSLVNDRPGADNFSYSETLQEWTKATNIRLRLLKTNTLLGHLMALAQQDPTVTRRYYYSIKDISVGGRCVCNGHADTCDTPGPDGRLICTCSHNTCGSECEMCCPGFVQKKWKPATLENSNECEPCNCHEHSQDCFYDEEVARERLSLDIYGRYDGGGVCIDCQHNTAGTNCELCQDGYFRQGGYELTSPYVCQPCQCDPYYSTGNCAPITGQCECRPRFTGPNCGECNEGYYDFPECKPCDCNINGTQNKICQANGGQCPCKPNYNGQFCDRCERQFYNFPVCSACDCHRRGSRGGACEEETGQCRCRDTYAGRKCDQCEDGHYGFPNCESCACSPYGVTEEVCDKYDGYCLCEENFGGTYCDRCAVSYFGYPKCEECGCDGPGSQYEGCSEDGQCYCSTGFDGLKCDRCANGYYRYPDCQPCECGRSGSFGSSCDQVSGQCDCRDGYQGRTCETCAEGFYNYPNCEECNCDPAGVIERPGQPTGRCGQTQGACTCKANVVGRACDSCAPLHFNLQRSNPAGCEDCDCFPDGTISGLAVCDEVSGQCLCKAAVDGRRCEECKDGYYRLEAGNAFGCVKCGCDVGGAIGHVCDKNTGQCVCRPRVTGRACAEPAQLHFFPSLHQIKFEIESGYTPSGGRPRIGYDDRQFPDFSYLGYGIMSSIQPVVLVTVTVDRPSIYRIILRYLYDSDAPGTGFITVTPTSPDLGSEQTSNIVFLPGSDPQFVTVEGGGLVTPFVLNPGEWTVRIEAPEGALLDYLVLLPAAFYEATVLVQSVADPCIPTLEQDRCNYYVYPSYDEYPSIRGVEGFFYEVNTNSYIRINQFIDKYIRDQLDVIDLAHLDERQDNLHLTLSIDPPGEYYFIVEYYGGGPGQQMATFDVIDGDNTMQGLINFYNCTFLCRSVVIGNDGGLQTFDIENDQVSIFLDQIGDPFFLAVSSVIAIPVSEFSYDFITPALECVRTSTGECIGGTHKIPTGSTVIDVYDPTGTGPTPPNMWNPITTVRFITTADGDKEVYIQIDLPPPGKYVFVVHYYQPNSTGFDVNFRIPGEFDSEGTFVAGYCPSISGCRTVVTLPDGSNEILLTGVGNSIHLSIPDDGDHSIWVDYILAIPADIYREFYSEDILNEIELDRAGEFITYCGSNSFFVSVSSPDLCKDGVFSISTEINNGALACDCNIRGSTGLTCEQIGGQCPCKNNIVGRQCDRCAIGYYNFPACQPCRCPTGVCNEVTGDCVCPDNVVGRRCDRCKAETYGYDPLAGCVNCGCDERGTLGSGNCDVDSGQCRCKPNVGGRQCDQCLPGFYQYPLCLECACDPAGTLPLICDQTTAQCLCKDNVVGARCDECPIGTFDLSEDNSQGCISCFCFGVTDDCKSYTRSRHPVPFRAEWTVTNLDDPLIRYSGTLVNVYVDGHGLQPAEVPFRAEWTVTNLDDPLIRYSGTLVNVYVDGHGLQPAEAIYWIPPQNFFGNQLNSYGGELSFTVNNRPKQGRGDLAIPAQPIRRPDVIIGGNGINVMYSNLEQPEPLRSLDMNIKLTEANFQYSFSGRPVSREDFMLVLANINQFEIRAQYFDSIVDASLSNVLFETTHRNGGGESASSVERCRCPPGYEGLSCESCAPGYYRISRGTFLGQCVPCQCNNHSNECDQETGYCLNCEGNTAGAQCQTCRTGYHGSALSTVDDEGCEACACPAPTPEQNFAETCGYDVNNNLYCVCLEGHVGRYCEMCDNGYFGDPSLPNGRCQPCDCSGNSDPSRPGMECDSLYGNCLRCLPETTGDHCENCAEWFYGDAVNLRNCQQCNCDRDGSESCDRTTGVCTCLPNVIGPTCDRCEVNHYNLESGEGCTPCDCGIASLRQQCSGSGSCECRPGVEGQKCDRCIEGFYQYTRRGCRACSCPPALRCDPETGECLCPVGAIGPNCDQCEERYVLTQDGCLPCDDCVLLLLDILADMDFPLEFEPSKTNVSVGIDTKNRLESINATIQALKATIKDMEDHNRDKIKPKLDDADADLKKLKRLAKRTLKQANKADRNSEGSLGDSEETLQRARGVLAKIEEAFAKIQDRAGNMTGPMMNQTSSYEDLLARALKILEEIRGRNHSSVIDESEAELELAKDLLARARQLKNASTDLEEHLQNVSRKVENFQDELDELANLTSEAEDNIDRVNETLVDPQQVEVIVAKTIELYDNATGDVQTAWGLIEDAREFLDDARKALKGTGANASALASAYDKLEDRYDEMTGALNESRDLVDRARAHADNLTAQADFLESLLVSTKELAQNAIDAANAYSNIVDAIEEAEKAALDAKNASSLADEAAQGFGDEPKNSKKKSNKLMKKGEKAIKKLESLEEDLETASGLVDTAKEKVDGVEYDLSEIEAGMRAIPSAESVCDIAVCAPNDVECKPGFVGENCNVAKFGETAQDAKMQAMDAQARAERAAAGVAGIIDEIPKLEEIMGIIPDGILETHRNTDESVPLVRKSRRLLDKFPGLIESLEDKHSIFKNISSNVKGNLTFLREQIEFARTMAHGIQVAAKLESSSSLQLRSSGLSDEPQSVNTISMYFLTNQPDALLFFAGGPGPSDEYIALQIETGELSLKYNLGDQDVTVPTAMIIADGLWHQVVARRTGKTAKLTIYSDNDGPSELSQEGQSTGSESILNLSEGWGIFIGGVGENFTAPPAVSVSPFVGGIDQIFFNQEPLGIWDFESASNVNQGIIRNVSDLAERPVPEDEGSISFDGEGYIKKEHKRTFGQNFVLGLSFKTHNPNGLLFFCAKQNNYITIELKNGRVIVTVAINGDIATLKTSGKYTTKKWTGVDLLRVGQDLTVTVAEGAKEEVKTTQLTTASRLGSVKHLYFGGLVGIKDSKYTMVTRKGFNGCMKAVVITGVTVNLLENVKSAGIYPNCITKDVRLVSFPAPYGGYVEMEPRNFYSTSEFLFSFRALQSTGLLAYLSDDVQEDVLAIQLNNGVLEASFLGSNSQQNSEAMITVEVSLNDWHTVSIERTTNRRLTIKVNDTVQGVANFRTRSSIDTDGYFFVGGLPGNVNYNQNIVPSLEPFVGCILNMAMDFDVLNFADRIGDQDAMFGLCSEEAVVVSEPTPIEVDATTLAPVEASTFPSGQCKLGFGGERDLDPLDEGAVFFGATNESRYQYENFERVYSERDQMSFSLKTAAELGVLYYTADNRQIDFTTLYLEDGQLVYSFSYGSDKTYIRTEVMVNDNVWHEIRTSREAKQGEIYIDGILAAEGSLTGKSSYLTTLTPLYVGGLPPNIPINDIPVPSRTSLIGCMKDFQVGPAPLAVVSEFEVPPCSGLVEPGAFFDETGGYLVLDESFSVGIDLAMTFDIKPRKSSGTIFSIQNAAMDFMSLELRSGELVLTVQNGGGEFSATYTHPSGEFGICDGKWYSVEVVKSRDTASITVNGKAGIPGSGGSQTEANTNDPLYFGGLPIGAIHDGIVESQPYAGCIRRITINGTPKSVLNARTSGGVNLRLCPAE